jgi:hypothetical protein
MADESNTRKSPLTTGITKELRNRSGWFFAEILVVVAGILIALWIDQWRDELERREIEDRYIEQIVAELLLSEERIVDSKRRHSRWVESIEELKAAFDGLERVQGERLAVLLSEAGFSNYPDLVVGSALALVSTGNVLMISESCVKARINDYLTEFHVSIKESVDYLFATHGDYHHQLLLEAAAHGFFTHLLGDAAAGSAVSSIESDLDGFYENARAYALVGQIRFRKRVFASFIDELLEQTAILRETLQGYLETGSISCN